MLLSFLSNCLTSFEGIVRTDQWNIIHLGAGSRYMWAGKWNFDLPACFCVQVLHYEKRNIYRLITSIKEVDNNYTNSSLG